MCEKILLTGANGYIGKELIQQGLFSDYELIKFNGDLIDSNNYKKYSRYGISKILHLGTLNNRSARIEGLSLVNKIEIYKNTNIDTISRLLELSEKNEGAQILNFSTMNIGNIEKIIGDDKNLSQIITNGDNLDIYSVSKLLAENNLRNSDLSIRLPSTSGKQGNIVMSFIEQLYNNKEINITTDKYFSFIGVEDIGKLVGKILKNGNINFDGSVKKIDSGDKITLDNLVKLIESKINLNEKNSFEVIKSDIDNFFTQLDIVPKNIEEQIEFLINKKSN